MSDGTVPDQMKIGRVTPIHKKDMSILRIITALYVFGYIGACIIGSLHF